MRRLEHCNIVKLKYFFYSSGDKVTIQFYLVDTPIDRNSVNSSCTLVYDIIVRYTIIQSVE